ncbi:RNA-directed RNA polymerase [ssRNA phage SRR7976356_6]|uniref:RNA-directed RNA polymerase n=1 Tax=ssRNA phage SRR7976356_6 TaxID=2786737 RepID=A0A8S5L1D4_9VIRU|nr:RNA-directed RNA polymerase [ssRNA phage SRR7976356_6]DAD51236.1 TPA_asm: RNA-directed RNA polymerase [ssRNA phage SRR7976356_6]
MHKAFQSHSEVFFALCKGVGSSYALAAWLRFKEGEPFLTLPSPTLRMYASHHEFAADWTVYTYFSKLVPPVDGDDVLTFDGRDLKLEALNGFMADEAHNRETRKRIRKIAFAPGEADVESLILRIQRKISNILGPFDEFTKWAGRFGNGATDALPRREAQKPQKYMAVPTVTASALRHWEQLCEESPLWLGLASNAKEVSLVRGNHFDTVPKSIKTHRTIAKEPLANGYLQQAVGVFMRTQLLRVGVDLKKGWRLNRLLAKAAYQDGWSTLDLKSASNSIISEVVWLLLPYDWAEYLDDIRSRETYLPDGTWHENVMFCSMGNGFTFALESLIFYAITSCFGRCAVFGDDIVVNRSVAPQVIKYLEFFGFRINHEKSFIDGDFFESCGGHYYRGFDVTPIYQKVDPLQSPVETTRAANRIYRWMYRLYGHESQTPMSSAYYYLSRHGRLFGPPLFDGDPFIFTSNEEKWHATYHRDYISLRSHHRVPVGKLLDESGAYLLDRDTAAADGPATRRDGVLRVEPSVTRSITTGNVGRPEKIGHFGDVDERWIVRKTRVYPNQRLPL